MLPIIFIYGLLPQIFSAKRIALAISTIFISGNDVINAPIFPLETVWRWSQLTAQFRGMPSVFERNTSEGIFRIVRVIGAIVTSPRYSITESRVRMRTGLFLSGRMNLYQRMSPRLMLHPNPARFPKLKIHPYQQVASGNLGGVFAPSLQAYIGQAPLEVPFLQKQSDWF